MADEKQVLQKLMNRMKEIVPQEDSHEDKPQAGGVTLNVQGLADVAQVIQAIEGMASALAQVMQAVNDLGAKHEESGRAMAEMSAKMDEQSGLIKVQNDIAMAPVVPELNAEGRIVSARKVLQ